MTPEETAIALAYANQVDRKVETNDATLDTWEAALGQVTYDEALWGIKNYYATTVSNNGWPTPAITPGTLRKLIHAERDRATAKQRALTPAPVHKRPDSYRARNPELWDRLVKQGRADHLADLQRRGIPPTAEQQKAVDASDNTTR